MNLLIKIEFGLIAALFLTACSTEQTYNGMQMQARSDCLKTAPQNEYAECVERTNTSFREYEQQRKASNDDGR